MDKGVQCFLLAKFFLLCGFSIQMAFDVFRQNVYQNVYKP